MTILDPLTGQTVTISAISAMTNPPGNPRRAYDAEGREIEPMTLANMREHGVRSVEASCQEIGCGNEGSINVDHLADDLPVPDVALRLWCSRCGSRNVTTIPDWRGGAWVRQYGSGC